MIIERSRFLSFYIYILALNGQGRGATYSFFYLYIHDNIINYINKLFFLLNTY